MNLVDVRKSYHRDICREIIRISGNNSGKEYPNFADGSNASSVKFAWGIVEQIGCKVNREKLSGQTAGELFEGLTNIFLENSFSKLHHLRPGNWQYSTNMAISDFDQYSHLADLEKIIKVHGDLASIIGQDYIINPDIVVGRSPINDKEVNKNENIIDSHDKLAKLTPLRESNQEVNNLILHASISCKWTIRSDRTQNTRTEALNLIRNRKGNLPHVVAVTAEPLPTRIAALALGTGDLDCVYHFALNELQETIEQSSNEDQLDMLQILVGGRRLRDISDLPFDLAI